MIKHIIPFLPFLLFACQDKQHTPAFSKPDQKDINQIVETIIFQDSLPSIRKKLQPDILIHDVDGHVMYRRKYCVPISIYLTKQKLVTADSNPLVPPGYNEIYIDGLIRLRIKGENFFTQEDSLYLIYQNNILKTCTLDTSLIKQLVVTTENVAIKKRERKRRSFFDFSIPIFSKNNKKAYVEVRHNCTGECGGAIAIYLEKINHNWTIVDQVQLWVS